MADKETLEQRLSDVEDAEHKFALGALEAKITLENGDEITFNRTNMGILKRYKQSLQRQLGLVAGVRLTV